MDNEERGSYDESVVSSTVNNDNLSPSCSTGNGSLVDPNYDEVDCGNQPQDLAHINIPNRLSNGVTSCKHCGKSFTRSYALKAHIYYYHSANRRSFSCKLCPRQFKWEAILKRHIGLAHKRKDLKIKNTLIDDISLNGETKAQLDANVEIIDSSDGNSFKCTTCCKVFSSISAIRLHRFSAHGTGPRQLCKICNKSLRPCHFVRHNCSSPQKNSSKSAPLSSQIEMNGDKAVNFIGERHIKVECSICHKTFKNRGSLHMHCWRHHSLQKRYCSGCRKSYLSSQFSSHRCCLSDNDQPHTRDISSSTNSAAAFQQCANLSSLASPNAPTSLTTQSKCDMCDRQYASELSLKDHMRAVHGVYRKTTTKASLQNDDTMAQQLHSDSVDNKTGAASSIAVRSSSSTIAGVAHGTNNFNNNNGTVLSVVENDQCAAESASPSIPLGRQQATSMLDSELEETGGATQTRSPVLAAATHSTNKTTVAPVDKFLGPDSSKTADDCECTTCHRSFKNSSALRLHRFSAHGACPRKMCTNCNKTFLPWHYLRHACTGLQTSEAKMNASKPTDSNNHPTEWKCSLCSRRYLSRYLNFALTISVHYNCFCRRTLKDHLRMIHGINQRRTLDDMLLKQIHVVPPAAATEGTQVSSDSSAGGGVLDLSCPSDAKRSRIDDATDTTAAENDRNDDDDEHGSALNLTMLASGMKNYKCGVCCKPFRDIAALRKHRYAAHGGCPKKMCPRCKKFLLPWHVKRHCCWNNTAASGNNANNVTTGAETTATADRTDATVTDLNGLPKCDLCHRQYANEHTLKCHLRVIHGVYQRLKENGEESDEVEQQTASSSLPMELSVTSSSPVTSPNSSGKKKSGGKMPLNLIGNECGVCHKVFQSHGAARLHLFSAHGACPKRLCTACNKWYLPWHYSRHFCQGATAQNDASNSKAAAMKVAEENTDVSTTETWKCDQCDRQYLSHRTLKDHLRIAHGVYQTKRSPSTTPGQQKTPSPPPNIESETKSTPSTANNRVPTTPSSESTNKNPGITVIGDPSSPQYECDICHKVFKSSSAARLHRLSGHGACPKKTCPNCNRTFLPCHFARHSCTALVAQNTQSPASSSTTATATSNSSGVEWKCHLCDRRYQSSRTLKDHLRIGHGVYQTKKSDMDKNRGSPSSLAVKLEEGGENLDSTELQQLLGSDAAGSPGKSTTGDSNPDNECDVCHKTFKSSSALRLHRYVTHVSRQRQLCTKCNKSFLPCHFPRHCCWSVQNGNTEASPAKKSRQQEPSHSAAVVSTEEPQIATCDICNRLFSSQDVLKAHRELEHGLFESFINDAKEKSDTTAEDDVDDVEVTTPTSGNGPAPSSGSGVGYKCGICHLPFSNLTDVRKHRYSTHGACPKRICHKCNKAILPCHFSRHACEPNANGDAKVEVNEPIPSDSVNISDEATRGFEWKCDSCDRRYLSK